MFVRYYDNRTVVRKYLFDLCGKVAVMSEALTIAASLYNDPRYFSKSEIRIRNNKIRRKNIVRRQFISLMVAISALIFIIVFNLTTFNSDAQSDTYVPEYKYYRSIDIHPGDNLWTIAASMYSADHYDDINDYIEEVCNINNLSDASDLIAGETLVIPYYSTEFK